MCVGIRNSLCKSEQGSEAKNQFFTKLHAVNPRPSWTIKNVVAALTHVEKEKGPKSRFRNEAWKRAVNFALGRIALSNDDDDDEST